MNDYTDPLAQQEALRLQMEEQRRQDEERQKREQEQRRQQMMASQPSQNMAANGINPGAIMSMMPSAGASPAASGIGGGAGGGAGAGGSLASAWPVAVAIAAIGQHQWAKGKGLHTNSDAITGRALYKDSEYYQQKGNAKLDGMGDEMRLAAMGSSPSDLLRKETWTTAAKLAAQGGILGKVLKKIF